MEQIFLDVVNLSLTASWVIAVVLLLRFVLKPVPKKYVCLLWFVVLFRLLCPVTLESEFSLVPPHEEVKYEIVYTTPQVETESEPVNNVLNQTVNPVLEQTSAPNPMGSVNPLQVYIFIAAWLWIIGIAVLCGYTFISWVRLRHQLAESIPDGGNVYVSDAITSPFVFGIVKPKIYLPYGLEDDERRWVLLHEQSHIARKDYLVKPLFWIAVIVHWMNPLVWITWFCFGRDLELACDERATASMNGNEKWNYSNTLLALAAEKRTFECPVAFSNNGVRQRIERILKYKQLPKVIIGVVLIVLMICGVGLILNPAEVYKLSDFEPKLVKEYPEGISNIKIQYGAIEAPMYSEYDKAEARNEFRNQLANLNVTKAKENNFPFTNTMISFMGMLEYGYDSERDMMYGSSEGCELVISDDFTTIFAKDTLKVKNPDALKELLLPYCNEAKTRYQQTTFYADLNHDSTDETIILNKGNWSSMDEVRLGVYQDDGTLLYSDSLYAAHAGWNNYFLYTKDDKDYLLEFSPTMYQGYADYSWKLMDFDRSGKLRIVDEEHVKFNSHAYPYEFDVEAILTFMEGAERVIRPSMLLVSTEDGELEYSTVNQPHTRTAESYLRSWLDDTPSALNMGMDTWNTLSLAEQLYNYEYDLQEAARYNLAHAWAETYGEETEESNKSRYALLSEDLQKSVDTMRRQNGATDEIWMPYSKYARVPMLKSYQITLNPPTGQGNDSFTENYSALIHYEGYDNAGKPFITEELIVLAQEGDAWCVMDGESVIYCLTEEEYQLSQQIIAQLKEGHHAWILDPELVAVEFAHRHLNLKNGTNTAWEKEKQMLVYTVDGTEYGIYLSQPVKNVLQPAYNFWYVNGYEITETNANGWKESNDYYISLEEWAERHLNQ